MERTMKAGMLARAVVVVGALAAAGAAANGAAAQATPAPANGGAKVTAATESDPAIEAARAKYASAQWSHGARRIGLPLGDLEIAGLRGEEPVFHAGGVSRRYVDATEVPRVLVELEVAEDAAGAHEGLLRHIAYVQSTKTLPTAASRAIAAGDVGFVGYGGRDGSRIAWLAFASGNLSLRVKNLDPDAVGAVDVTPVVIQVAELAAAQPLVAEGAALPRPQIARFAPEATTVVAGESLRLDLLASDVDGRPVAFDFTVGGWQQGQGYVEQDEQGAWRFHATGAGTLALTLEARSRFGTTTRQTLELAVTR